LSARTAFRWTVVLVGLALLTLGAPSFSTAETADLLVAPYVLHVTESFQGATITVSAEIPKDASAIVEVKGPTHKEHLLRQGRRGGLWMSVGEVTVEGAPSLYLVLSTPDVSSHLEGKTQWGYDALKQRITFEGSLPKQGRGALFDQFVKLKESQGVYGVFPDSLKLTSTSGGQATYEGQFRLPGNIAPGTYPVVLSVLKGGKVVQQQSTELTIEMSGLPRFLTALAWNHSALYGLMAVLVALAAGFIMGFVFRSKAAH
jgi:hypothetical protein